MLERRTNDAVITIQKAYRHYKQKRYYLETRADIFDVVNGRKERRRGSLNREYKGDYLGFLYNKLVIGLLSQSGVKEKLLFADRCNFITLKGKQGVLKSIFGKKEAEPIASRFLVLS